MRQVIELDAAEEEHFRRLQTTRIKREGAAWAFWKEVCARRGLDYKTLIKRTALPLGHDQYWCWPQLLKLPPIPDWIKEEVKRYG